MSRKTRPQREDLDAHHAKEWRDPAQIASQWREADQVDPRLLESRTTGAWWKLLGELRITLMVTREYEHLVVALSAGAGRRQSFFPVPHPSGLAVDRANDRIVLASTRNPNQVFTMRPVRSLLDRRDVRAKLPKGSPLVPSSSTYYPGCMYLHDLAIVGGRVYANAVGQNAVVRLEPDGLFERVWWPRCIEVNRRPVFERNHLQLNSIAAGPSIRDSFFSASSDRVEKTRPGHLNYPVDRRGVIFSGRTREPVCTGLTRPHSARLWKKTIWVANSGYGELGYVRAGRFESIARLPGWTRGLCIVNDVAFVATSRVIPRYARYAPGVDAGKSQCAVHAVSLKSGKTVGSMEWPLGNQIFAIDWIDSRTTEGFVFETAQRRTRSEVDLFYSYRID